MEEHETTVTTSLSNATKFKWLISILLPFLILLVSTSDVFTSPIRSFVVVTLFGILLFGFELVDTMVGALILMFGYVIGQVAPLSTVMQPWLQDLPWMTLGSLLLVAIIQRTTLLNRIAYFCVIRTGGTYTGIIMGLITSTPVYKIKEPKNATLTGVIKP